MRLFFPALHVFLFLAPLSYTRDIPVTSDYENDEDSSQMFESSRYQDSAESISGIDLIVTQQTADYLNENLISILQNDFVSFSLPDTKLKKLSLYSINIGKLNIDESSISFIRSGLNLQLSKLGLKGTAKYKYRWWFTFRGNFNLWLKDSSISLTILATKNDGLLSPSISGCSVKTNVGFRMSGFLGWIASLFRSYISKKIENYINKKACHLIRDELKTQTSNLAHSYSLSSPLGKFLKVNYGLVSNPVFQTNYLFLPFIGIESHLVSATEVRALSMNSSLVSTSNSAKTDRMMYFRIKPFILNTALLAYYRADSFVLKRKLNDFDSSVIDMVSQSMIPTSNPLSCENDSNCIIYIKISALDAPKIEFFSNEICAKGSALLKVYFNNTQSNLFTNVIKLEVNVLICSNLTIHEENGSSILIPQISSAKVISSNLRHFIFTRIPDDNITELINLLFTSIQPEVNDNLSDGISIKQSKKFSIYDPIVNVNANYLEVGANLVYLPWES